MWIAWSSWRARQGLLGREKSSIAAAFYNGHRSTKRDLSYFHWYFSQVFVLILSISFVGCIFSQFPFFFIADIFRCFFSPSRKKGISCESNHVQRAQNTPSRGKRAKRGRRWSGWTRSVIGEWTNGWMDEWVDGWWSCWTWSVIYEWMNEWMA